MAFTIPQIAKLLGKLALLIPVTNSIVKTLGETGSRFQEETSMDRRLNYLENALDLQSGLNGKITDQLQIVESVLINVEKSLKVLAYITAGTAVLAVVAITVALLK
jgi:hypothetical protein